MIHTPAIWSLRSADNVLADPADLPPRRRRPAHEWSRVAHAQTALALMMQMVSNRRRARVPAASNVVCGPRACVLTALLACVARLEADDAAAVANTTAGAGPTERVAILRFARVEELHFDERQA